MGIPGLFANLVRKYNSKNCESSIIKQTIYTSQLENESVVDETDNTKTTNYNEESVHLYLDFNGAMYQVIKPEIKTKGIRIKSIKRDIGFPKI